jgi:hypothetical protein
MYGHLLCICIQLWPPANAVSRCLCYFCLLQAPMEPANKAIPQRVYET